MTMTTLARMKLVDGNGEDTHTDLVDNLHVFAPATNSQACVDDRTGDEGLLAGETRFLFDDLL